MATVLSKSPGTRHSGSAEPSTTPAPRAGAGAPGRRAAGTTYPWSPGLFSDPFRLALVLAINAAVVAGIVSTAVILRNRKPPAKPITLAMALRALDRGDAAEAQRMAQRLAASKDVTTEDWGGPDFILGTLTARAAEKASGGERADAFRTASLYFARCRERGFPQNREAAGLRLLGKSLCMCDRLQSALPVLEKAVESKENQTAELRLLLISARMGVQSPELDKARAECQALLAEPQLSDSDRRQALIEQAQILIRMNRTQECAATLAKIPDSPLLRCDVSLLRGRLALREGQALKKAATPGTMYSWSSAGTAAGEVPKDAKEKFRSAIESFRKAQVQDLGDNRVARQANYLIGLCLLEQGDVPAALNEMQRTARFFPHTPEHLAALYQQIMIARSLGRHPEAVLAYQQLLSAYARQDEFQNPWINLAEMKASLLAICQDYLKAEQYQTAVLLSKSLAHLFPKAEALQLTARIYRTWAENLLEQAEQLPRPAPTSGYPPGARRADELRKQAREHYRQAGATYTEVARELYTTRQYPEQLWYSASAYFAGHDFRNAAAKLQAYMHNEARMRHAQALVDLGESQLALGQTPSALKSFQACIEQHPRDVAVYRARLLASRAALGLGDLKQAEAFLQDNLNGEQLTPASKEWRDSLFALGELLHNAARDREAIPRLDEALERYPRAPQAILARYFLADSSRRLAMDLRSGLGKEISSAVRTERAADGRRLLDRALEAYRWLAETLGGRRADSMSAEEISILRNSRFALGGVYFELERYREALQAYQSAANHYAASPEVLDAYLQIANVYRRMDRPAEARTALAQARMALLRIPPEAHFEQTTNYNRKQWGALLDRLCSL